MWKNNLEQFKFNMEDIKVFDSFSGIGALHKSLNKLGVPTKLVGISEVDPDSIIDYAAIHLPKSQQNEVFNYPKKEEIQKWLMDRNIGWDFKKQKSSIPRMKLDKLNKLYKASVLLNNLGDISKINPNDIPDFDMFNMSFPCQSFSIAGKRMGVNDFRGTLGFVSLKLLEAKKPKYFMIENVLGLISIEDGMVLTSMLQIACDSGYHIMTNTMNAKGYGIPQNRNRLFVIGVRDDLVGKNKNIVDNEINNKRLVNILNELKNQGTLKELTNFNFPKKFDNEIRLKHLLEDTVDEKYYLSDEYNKRFIESLGNEQLQNKIPHGENYNVLGTTVQPNAAGTNSRHWVYDTNNNCSCLSATDYKQPKQILEETNKLNMLGMLDIKGNEQIRRVYDEKGLSPTLSTMQGGNRQPKVLEENNFKIRKLTPLECWRLMGFDDEDFYAAKSQGTSDGQLYKQAGNSIVVNCLYYIFKELFKEYIIGKKQIKFQF